MAIGGRRVMAAAGLLIALAGAGLLAWNEYYLVRQLDAVAAARNALLSDGTEAAPPAVHVVGSAAAAAPVTDPAFALTVRALRLDRTAETYQWLETREGSGNDKVLRHEKVWSPVLIRSERFEQRSFHVNPPALRLATERFRATGSTVHGDLLDPALIDALPPIRELRPDQDAPVRAGDMVFARGGDWLYSGDPGAPRIGDVRVRFAVAPEGVISLVATRVGDRLAPFDARGGGRIALAAYGEVPADTLLRESARVRWREAWQRRGFAAMAVLVGTLFAMPELGARFAASPLFARRRRVRTMLLLAAGAVAGVGAMSWLGARLLLWLMTPPG